MRSLIIGKKDAIEGTIYYTKNCNYLVLEEEGLFVVEVKPEKERLGLLNFILENDESFLLGCYESEEKVFEAIAEFERIYWI